MKRWFSIVLSAAAALMVVGVLGVANADTGPTTTPAAAPPPRVITVNGSGARGVPTDAPPADAVAAYNQALTDALADARGKATALAGATSLTLGAVQSVVEQSSTPVGGCSNGYPMSAMADGKATARRPAHPPKPAKPARKHGAAKKPKQAASRAVAPGSDPTPPCEVDASLTVSYAVGG